MLVDVQGPVETSHWFQALSIFQFHKVCGFGFPCQGQRQRLGSGNLLDLHRQEEAARKKAREEKARQARQAAIQVPGTPGVILQPVHQRALLSP